MTAPVFAVVGHPNKGKSSIVATLARDESVAISPLPGTTVEHREYPLVIDGETLYVLVDTPGFQRARAALEWMQEQAGSALERPDIVRRFVDQHRSDPRFDAEVKLLTPLLDGAGILYVVDGSRPFGPEYEAEMEILRWTGQPSLALINLIGDGDYTGEWQSALEQYFRIVRVFDAMTADFDKRIQLLRAFGQIRESWHEPLERALRVLEAEQVQRRGLAARRIAQSLGAMLTHTCEKRVTDSDPDAAARHELGERYSRELVALEQAARRDVEQIYNYRRLQRHEPVMELLDEDLFARQTWTLFGLTRQQLIATGSAGGAAAGGVIDLAVGGASLLLGAGLGALIGGASAWATADRVAKVRLLGRALGGKVLSVGPMRAVNFPYVVLGRALLHHRMIEDRTHACRDPLELRQAPGPLQDVTPEHRKRLEKVFGKMRNQDALSPDLVDTLAGEIEQLMQGSATPPARSSTTDATTVSPAPEN